MTDVETVLRRVATWNDVIRGVALEFGEKPSDDECGFILWEHTGYPAFWNGDPVESCIGQVRGFYEGMPAWWRYQARLRTWQQKRRKAKR